MRICERHCSYERAPQHQCLKNTVCIMYKVNYNDQMLLYSCKLLLIHEELVTLNGIVSDIAIFVLKRDAKLQLTN